MGISITDGIIERIYGKLSSFIIKHRFEGVPTKPTIKNKSFIYILFMFLVFLSFVIKYPVTGYGGGIDSHFYHQLTNIILQRGSIPWIKSPLSVFDLYPIGANTGVPIMVSSLANLSKMDAMQLFLPFSYIQSVVVIPAAFLAAYEFKRDIYFASFTTTIYSVTTRYIFYTNFLYGSRGFFLTFVPFFFWALFRYSRERNHKNLTFVVLFAIISLSIHSMGLLLILVSSGFIIGPILHDKIAILLLSHRKGAMLIGIMSAIAAFLFFISSYFYDIAKIGNYLGATPDRFLLGTDPFSYLIALGYNYGKWVGAFLPIALIGFLLIIFKSDRTWRETSLLVSFVFFLPLFGGFMYIAPFLFFMFSLLISYTIFHYRNILKGNKQKFFVIVFVLTVVVSASVLNILVYRVGEDDTHSYWMEERYFSAGMYMRYNGDDYFAYGDWLNTRKVAVVAMTPYGVTFERGYGHVDRFDYSTVRIRPFDRFIARPDMPFEIDSWYWAPAYHYNGIIKDRIINQPLNESEVQQWIAISGMRLMIRDEASQVRLGNAGWDNLRDNPSVLNMPEFFRYKIYRNDELAVYYL